MSYKEVSEWDREKKRWNEWFTAAHSGDVDTLARMIDKRKPEDERGKVFEWVELTDPHDHTAFRICAESGHSSAMKWLESKGANKLIADASGETVLHVAASKGHAQVCDTAVGLGVPVNSQSKYGQTALLIASRGGKIAAVKTLIALGADPKIGDRHDATPLLEATRQNHKEVCIELLGAGASLLAADNKGHTPVSFAQRELTQLYWWTAASQGNVKALSRLLARQIGSAGDEGFKDLGRALYQPQGQDQTLLNLHRELCNCRDSQGFTALSRATQGNHVAAVEYLLSQAADPTLSDTLRETPLHHAARMGHTKIADLLIDAGTAMEALNLGDNTPLHVAAWAGSTAIVKLICKAGANVNATDKIHATPLHHATGRRHADVVQVLYHAGASVDMRCKDHKTPADWAWESNIRLNKPRPRHPEDIGDYDEKMEPPVVARRFVVCHTTRVAVRSAPSAEGKITGARFPNEEVWVVETRKGWAKLQQAEEAKPGAAPPAEQWMLIDGKDLGLGLLLKREDKEEEDILDSDSDDDFAG